MKIYKLFFICLVIGLVGLMASSNVVCAAGPNKTAPKNALSFEQIKMAAESGDADAQYALGYMYYYGKGGAPKDAEQAKTWIGKSAAQKQPQAIKALALMNGRGSQSTTNQKTTTDQASTPEHTEDPQENKSPTSNEVDDRNTVSPQASHISNHEKMNLADTHNKKEEMNLVGTRNKKEEMNLADTHSKKEEMNLADARNKKEEMNLVDTHNKREEREENEVSPKSHKNGLYTLQLLGASNREHIAKMVKDNHLGDSAKIYKTTFKNKDWYILVYGQYHTKSEANSEANRLESKLALKPWVKPYSSVSHLKLTHAS